MHYHWGIVNRVRGGRLLLPHTSGLRGALSTKQSAYGAYIEISFYFLFLFYDEGEEKDLGWQPNFSTATTATTTGGSLKKIYCFFFVFSLVFYTA